MRIWHLFFALTIVSSCTLIDAVDRREVAYITYKSRQDPFQIVVRAINIFERSDAPVRFEASRGQILTTYSLFQSVGRPNEITPPRSGSEARNLGVKGDGSQVFVNFSGRVAVYNAAEGGELLGRAPFNFMEDIDASCNLLALFQDEINAELREQGIQLPLTRRPQVELPRPEPGEHILQSFEGLGWTDRGEFVIAYRPDKIDFFNDSGNPSERYSAIVDVPHNVFFYIEYALIPDRDLEGEVYGVLGCSTTAPTIVENRAPTKDSYVLRRPLPAKIFIDDEIVYRAFVGPGDTAVPMTFPNSLDPPDFYGQIGRAHV